MASDSRSTPSRATAASRPLACQRCRRNRSFCTKEKPRCATCRKGKHVCEYSDGRRVSVLASYVQDLESRLRRYEDAAKATQSPIVHPEMAEDPDIGTTVSLPQLSNTPPNCEPGCLGHESDFRMHTLAEGLENLVISPSGVPQYLGSSSSPILVRGLRDAVGIITPLSNELGVDREVATYNPNALHPRRLSTAERAILPPHPTAQRYFAAQYRMIGTIFSFVQPDVFQEQLAQAYAGPPSLDDTEASLSYCQVLLIMAFGQTYAINQYTDGNGPPGFAFFTEALHFLPGMHEEPSVLFCGVLALAGYFMQNLNRRDAAFMYLGLAQRMAITLALHEEVSVPGLDEITKEQRRRTWWSIYSLDRILCVKYGNPVTMQDDDIQVALPSRLDHEPTYCGAVVLRHYTMLSKILGQIMTRIYGKTPKSGSGLVHAIQDIMKALRKWDREIPDQLRFDPVRLTRESVSTFLHYNQCVSMASRPLLLHIVKKRLQSLPEEQASDWKDKLSQTAISVIETCIAAACDSVYMMTVAAEKDLVAVFGYMDGEHLFSAALVLVMVSVAFPPDADVTQAMTAALSLLEMMASKGNFHIEARRNMLVEVLSTARTADPTLNGKAPLVPPAPNVHLPALGGMDDEAFGEMFAMPPDGTEMRLFERAYQAIEMNIEYDDPNFWMADPDHV